jgi:hypothetical protein
MEILGADGKKITRTDEDLKSQESFLRAKVLAQANKHGAVKPEFKGMVKGEAVYGNWYDGLSDDAVNVVLGAANSAFSPEQRQNHLRSLGINNEAPKPVYNPQEEEIIKRMTPDTSKSISKSIFGF